MGVRAANGEGERLTSFIMELTYTSLRRELSRLEGVGEVDKLGKAFQIEEDKTKA